MTLATDGGSTGALHEASPDAPALVVVAHSGNDAEGREAVAQLVASVIANLPGVTGLAAFVDVQQPDVSDVLDALRPGRAAVVVPLLLSTGHHVHSDLVRELAHRRDRRVRVADLLGPDDAIIDVLTQRLTQAGLRDDDLVVLAAAGSSDHRAVRDCLDAGRMLASRLERPVTAGFITAAVPHLSSAIETMHRLHPSARMLLSSYLLAPGLFADLATAAGADVVSGTLLVPGTPAPEGLVDLVARRYLDAAQGLAAET